MQTIIDQDYVMSAEDPKDMSRTIVLTRAKLWEGIKNFLKKPDDGKLSGEKRHSEQFKTILNDLFNPSSWEIDVSKKETPEGQRKAKVDELVSSKSQLVSFTFFLQANPQFSYLWSYLLKKIEDYGDFLIKYESFIDRFMADISQLEEKIKHNGKSLCYNVNDFIRITITGTILSDVNLDLKNFSSSLLKSASDKHYNLRVIYEKTILGVYRTGDKKDLDKIAEEISNYLSIRKNEK